VGAAAAALPRALRRGGMVVIDWLVSAADLVAMSLRAREMSDVSVIFIWKESKARIFRSRHFEAKQHNQLLRLAAFTILLALLAVLFDNNNNAIQEEEEEQPGQGEEGQQHQEEGGGSETAGYADGAAEH